MLLRRSFVAVLALAVATPASAHGPDHGMGGGKPGEAGKVTRIIEVVASDNEFSLKSLQVKDGETIRFIVRNDGFDPHEFLIGTKAAHSEHLKMMREMIEQQKKGDGHAHAMPMMEAHESGVSVQPGKTGTFVWTFARTPNLEFACDIPGHYEDGMHGPITFSR
ncbi:MAG: plastocyanin/azurin family copper-binding protein [Betaproteobacteria bacterium]